MPAAVVGDNVMLTVATSDLIVGPTRLLFPRGSGGTGEAADFPFSLLGLGDIAIPGAPAADRRAC
jgi:minor histocompatibility antigen H13